MQMISVNSSLRCRLCRAEELHAFVLAAVREADKGKAKAAMVLAVSQAMELVIVNTGSSSLSAPSETNL